MAQTTSHILMIEPVAFRYNEETAANNYYQAPTGEDRDVLQSKALSEFSEFVGRLKEKGIDVTVIKDIAENDTPDSIFPNNWVSFHEDGKIVLYPMFAKSRRKERRPDIVDLIRRKFGFDEVIDLSGTEEHDLFLEGTGSIILDRENRIAYAAISERTDRSLFFDFCDRFDYKPVPFTAYQTVDGQRLPIYHTNVMMEVGKEIAVVCLECVDDLEEQSRLKTSLENSGKTVIPITEKQVEQFAGNMLEVHNQQGISYQVMSTSAYRSLSEEQKKLIEEHCEIVHSPLDTIEANAGGSARCMMAEIFTPKV